MFDRSRYTFYENGPSKYFLDTRRGPAGLRREGRRYIKGSQRAYAVSCEEWICSSDMKVCFLNNPPRLERAYSKWRIDLAGRRRGRGEKDFGGTRRRFIDGILLLRRIVGYAGRPAAKLMTRSSRKEEDNNTQRATQVSRMYMRV